VKRAYEAEGVKLLDKTGEGPAFSRIRYVLTTKINFMLDK